MKKTIEVKGLAIAVDSVGENDFISLTDLARHGDGDPTERIRAWLRNASTLLFLEAWEEVHNPGFKVGQMAHFIKAALDNCAVVSAKSTLRKQVPSASSPNLVAAVAPERTPTSRSIFATGFRPLFRSISSRNFNASKKKRPPASTLNGTSSASPTCSKRPATGWTPCRAKNRRATASKRVDTETDQFRS